MLNKLLKRAEKFPVFRILPLVYVLLAVGFALLIRRGDVQLLNPAGTIADEQSKILWGVIGFAVLLGSIMIGGFFLVVLRFREGQGSTYKPEWRPNKLIMTIGWAVPFLALSAISVMVWITAHQVDPYKPIASNAKPITIQVVALRWKWLFIYPNEHIATVNTLTIPTNTPVSFELTADAPMNSFWVPRLSGQIYAMTGMVTHLHVMADKPGVYDGGPAEISGDEFAGMEFKVHAVTPAAYASWAEGTSESSSTSMLNYAHYKQLAKPSAEVGPAAYRLGESNLFDVIVMQFMIPSSSNGGSV